MRIALRDINKKSVEIGERQNRYHDDRIIYLFWATKNVGLIHKHTRSTDLPSRERNHTHTLQHNYRILVGWFPVQKLVLLCITFTSTITLDLSLLTVVTSTCTLTLSVRPHILQYMYTKILRLKWYQQTMETVRTHSAVLLLKIC